MNRHLVLLLSLFASGGYAQTAASLPGVILGPERRVADQRLAAYVAGPEEFANIVPDGGGFLAVWVRRTSFSRRPAVRAVHIDSRGFPAWETTRALVEESTIGFALASATAAGPIILWTDGTGAWTQRIGGSARSLGAGRTARSFVCNARRCLVSWGPTGTILDGDGNIVADNVPLSQEMAPVAADPGGFLLAGFRGEEVAAMRLTNEGRTSFAVVANRPFTSPQRAAADFDGKQYVLAWTSVASVWASTISLDGTMSAPARPFDIAATLEGMVWDGAEHLLALSIITGCFGIEGAICPTDLYTVRMRADLVAHDRELRPLSADPTRRSFSLAGPMAVNQGKVYAGMRFSGGNFGIALVGSLIDADGLPSTRSAISLAPQSQFPSRLVSTGAHHLALWTEPDAAIGTVQLRSARVSRDGVLLDPQPRLIAEAPVIWYADAGAAGSDTLIAWFDGANARAIIEHDDGSMTPADPVAPGVLLVVGGNTSGWLVANGSGEASLISRAGINLTPRPIAISDKYSSQISIASDGSRFLVVSDAGGTFVSVINADGSVAVKDRKIADDRFTGAVAWNGHSYLVVTGNTSRLSLRRLDRQGAPIGTPLTIDSNSASLIAPFCGGWLVILRSGAAFRVAADGTQIDQPLPFEPPMSIAGNADGSVTAAWVRDVERPPYGSAPAMVLRDLTWSGVQRRRAVR